MAFTVTAGIGTGIQTPPATLVGTLNAVTQKHIMPTLGDAVMTPSPALWSFTKNGKKIQGGEIVYPILSVEETTGGAYYGDQLLNTAVSDSVVPATQVWRSYYQSIALPVTDAILNRGASGVLDIAEMKFEIAAASLLQKLSRALFHTSPQNTSIDIDDIEAWVNGSAAAGVAATNTIAGINRTTETYWRPQTNVDAGSVALTPAKAEEAYQKCVFGYDEPDLMLIDNDRFKGFKQQFTSNVRYNDPAADERALQAGFRYQFMFNNAVVMPDRFCTSNQAYLINTKYLYPVFHENDYFVVEPWIKPSNQRVVVSQMFVTWQLICPSPRMNCAILAITA